MSLNVSFTNFDDNLFEFWNHRVKNTAQSDHLDTMESSKFQANHEIEKKLWWLLGESTRSRS